jgi:hypothetical protein
VEGSTPATRAELSVVALTVTIMEVNMAPRRERPYKHVSTLTHLLISIAVAAVGVVLLYFGGRNSLWEQHRGLQALVNSLGGLLVVSVAVAGLWELWGKRSFVREILETARTSTDVEAAGVVRIGTNYVEDPDWEDLFRGVRKIDIFFAYGRTWRNNNLTRLRTVAASPDARIRVYLPDPGDTDTLKPLMSAFNMTRADLVRAIGEARQAFQSLRQPGGADIQVWFRKGEASFSCYRFDRAAVITLYSHGRERTNVPTIVCRDGGSLYEFVRAEFRALEAQSVRATP